MAGNGGVRTQVAIVGAGPSGLLLSHLLAARGVESMVIENRSPEYVLSRIRAGVLESSSVELLEDAGLGDRLRRQGIEHRERAPQHARPGRRGVAGHHPCLPLSERRGYREPERPT